MESVTCNLCAKSDTTMRHEIRVDDSSLRYYRFARRAAERQGTYRITECRRCGLMFVHPRPDLADAAGNSANTEDSHHRHFSNYLFRADQPDDLGAETGPPTDRAWRFDSLAQFGIRPGAAVLDIGCGSGDFVRAAVDRGYDAVGIDDCPDRVAEATATPELAVRIQLAPRDGDPPAFDGRVFDAITLWDVLEGARDPLAVLRGLQPYCHPDTRILAQTTSTSSFTYRLFGARWHHLQPVTRPYYFSHKTLMTLFENTGFGLLDIGNDGTPPPTPWRLLRSLARGLANQLMFRIYGPQRSWATALRPLLRPWQGGLSDDRMRDRLENLCPTICAPPLRGSFVYVARPCGSWVKQADRAEPASDPRSTARSVH